MWAKERNKILHHSIKGRPYLYHSYMAIIYLVSWIINKSFFSKVGRINPLTLIGPKGIQNYIETSLKLSESHLNYPITYIEINQQFTYHHEGLRLKPNCLIMVSHTVIVLKHPQHQVPLMWKH